MDCIKTDVRPLVIGDYDEVIALWHSIEGIGLDEDTDSRENTAAYLDRNPGLSPTSAV